MHFSVRDSTHSERSLTHKKQYLSQSRGKALSTIMRLGILRHTQLSVHLTGEETLKDLRPSCGDHFLFKLPHTWPAGL